MQAADVETSREIVPFASAAARHASAAAFDAHCPAFTINGRFLTQPLTGVQRYAREIVDVLDDVLLEAGQRALLCAPGGTPAQNFAALDLVTGARFGGQAWEQLRLPLQRRGPVLNLCNMAPLLCGRQVVCMHDANVVLQPDSYTFAFRTAYRILAPLVARRAARLTTVSAFSAATIAQHFGVMSRSIAVLPNGHEHVRRWDAAKSRIFADHRRERPYVLVIASRARHKNVGRILAMADTLDSLGLDIWLAGGTSGIFADVSRDPARNVKRLGYVSDDDLAALYANAVCLAFPSLTEGFGLPLIEAMALGCPVVSSNRASMPEVCGDAALMAAPDDSAAWLAHFAALASSDGLRQDLVGRGRERVRRFSWRETANGYADLLRELA